MQGDFTWNTMSIYELPLQYLETRAFKNTSTTYHLGSLFLESTVLFLHQNCKLFRYNRSAKIIPLHLIAGLTL